MNAIITLKNNQHELELPLDASYSTFNGNQQLYVVYQDFRYSFLLTLKEVYDEITHLELYINDTQQLIQWTRVSENEYSIQIDTYPFYMICFFWLKNVFHQKKNVNQFLLFPNQ